MNVCHRGHKFHFWVLALSQLACRGVQSSIYIRDEILEYQFLTVSYFGMAETPWGLIDSVSSNRVAILPSLNLDEVFKEEYNNETEYNVGNFSIPLSNDDDDDSPKILVVDFPSTPAFNATLRNVSEAAEIVGADFVVLVIDENTPWKERFAFWWSHKFPGSSSEPRAPKNSTHKHYFFAMGAEQGEVFMELLRELLEENRFSETFYNGTVQGIEFTINDTNTIAGQDFVSRIFFYFLVVIMLSRYMGEEGRSAGFSYTRFTGEDLGQGLVQESSEEQDCPVCLETMQPGETVRILPCRHILHHECISGWFEQGKYTCPLCKMDLTDHLEEQRQASIEIAGTSRRSWLWPFSRRIGSLDHNLLTRDGDEEFDGDLELTEESGGVLT